MAKPSLKDKLRKKRKELSEKGGYNVLSVKEGTTRIRILPIEQEELAAEVTYFFLKKGVYSAASVGEHCPIMDKYTELKNSKDDDDQELAKKLSPKKRYLIPVILYEDEKGKKIDKDKSGKLMLVTGGVYQNIIDLYLDEDEWGDMMDPKKGYDIKIIRTGKGQNDTEYTVSPCKRLMLNNQLTLINW